MLWLIVLSCRTQAPPPPLGPVVEPGTYSFWSGSAVPGCTQGGPEVQLVHVDKLAPIRQTMINRSGRYHRIEVRGTEGWVAVADADDPRLLMMLSSDEPAATCLQAEIRPLGEDRWFTRTSQWVSVINLTTSRVRHLAKAQGELSRCMVTEGAVACRGPKGPVRFDRDGVVVSGTYLPQWAAEYDE
ncbi:MAG: hypothetical protein AAGA48_31960 [Myxococcota bacterium]